MPRMERRVTVVIDAPPELVEAAAARAEHVDHHGTVRLECRTALRGVQVIVIAENPVRVPFFQWFFGPVFGFELCRRARWAVTALRAALAGAEVPPPPTPLPLSPPEAFSAEQTALIATVCLASALASMGGALFGQNLDPLARSFRVSNDQLGVALAVTRLGVLFSLVAAALADRRGRRQMLLLALVVVCVGNAASAVAPGLEIFTATQLLVRAAVNAVIVVGGIAVVEEAPEGARAFAVAMLSLAAGAGFAVAVVLLPLADIGPETWRIAFGISALGVVLVPVLGRHLHETRRYTRLVDGGLRRGRVREVVERSYRPRLLILAGIGFLTNVFSAPSAQFMNRYLLDERGFSNSRAALFRGVTAGVPGLIGIVMGGRLTETRGRRPVAVVSLLVGTVCTMIFFLGSGIALWVTATLAILAAAPATLAVGTMDAELFPTEVRGTSNALLLVSYVAGSATGLLAAGLLSDPLGGLGPALALCGFAPLVAAVLLLPRLPESRGRLLDEVSPTRCG